MSVAQIKRWLRSHRIFFNAARAAYYFSWLVAGQVTRLFRNRTMLRAYLKDNRVAKLHLGCEHVHLPRWFNTDKYPRHRWAAYCDVARRFPFPPETFDRAFSEHVIEHMPFPEALNMLRECHRVLKPVGRIRIATPDLRKLAALLSPNTPEQREYLSVQRSEIPWALDDTPGFVINNAVRAWGHQFIYDQDTMTSALRATGFEQVELCAPSESRDPEFVNVDQHGRIIGSEVLNRVETFVMEATKRGRGQISQVTQRSQ